LKNKGSGAKTRKLSNNSSNLLPTRLILVVFVLMRRNPPDAEIDAPGADAGAASMNGSQKIQTAQYALVVISHWQTGNKQYSNIQPD
jgi:hypothetical protein